MSTPTIKTFQGELETPDQGTTTPTIRNESIELQTPDQGVTTPLVRIFQAELQNSFGPVASPLIRNFFLDWFLENAPPVVVLVTSPKLPQVEDMTADIRDALSGSTGASAADPFATESLANAGNLIGTAFGSAAIPASISAITIPTGTVRIVIMALLGISGSNFHGLGFHVIDHGPGTIQGMIAQGGASPSVSSPAPAAGVDVVNAGAFTHRVQVGTYTPTSISFTTTGASGTTSVALLFFS